MTKSYAWLFSLSESGKTQYTHLPHSAPRMQHIQTRWTSGPGIAYSVLWNCRKTITGVNALGTKTTDLSCKHEMSKISGVAASRSGSSSHRFQGLHNGLLVLFWFCCSIMSIAKHLLLIVSGFACTERLSCRHNLQELTSYGDC